MDNILENKYLLLVIFLTVLSLRVSIITPTSFAQTPKPQDVSLESAATLGVAHMILVKDPKLRDGTIISTGSKGAVATIIPYDSQVLGVVSRDAAIIFSSNADKGSLPVISTGLVYIFASNKEGKIKKGDLITTSIKPGVAVKATKDGFVLGTALEDLTQKDPNKSELIAGNLDLHYFNSKPTFPGSLSDIFKLVLLPTKEGPNPFFKYIMAGLVALGSMILGFMTFGRAAAKGVEALGRNPAASRIIHLGIIFNVGITIAIALSGLVVAFLILRL